MIYKIHYWFLFAGLNAVTVLMGVYLVEYTDATALEIGFIYLINPIAAIIFRPLIGSMADRSQAHKKYLMTCQILTAITYTPFVVIPLLGAELYTQYSGVCWYMFVALKVVGDISMSGSITLSDTLAINYAKRLGLEFTVYRVWGTFAWMIFGCLVGQVNEVWFLPKYVPAFLVLLSCATLDSILIWITPDEYFKVDVSKHQITTSTNNEKSDTQEAPKSLMTNQELWAHMKGKLRSLFICGSKPIQTTDQQPKPVLMIVHQETIADKKPDAVKESHLKTKISLKTQLKILFRLISKDQRIVLYFIFFAVAGISLSTVGYLFMEVSELSAKAGIEFSRLAGFIQASMAGIETILFYYIKPLKKRFGRLDFGLIAYTLLTIKFTYYIQLMNDVHPYFTLLSEMCHGVSYGIFLTLSVGLAHEFSQEVRYIIPEMIENGMITDEYDRNKLQHALAATMQAVLSAAEAGLGRTVGLLMGGYMIEKYSYEQFWMICQLIMGVGMIVVLGANILNRIVPFKNRVIPDEKSLAALKASQA